MTDVLPATEHRNGRTIARSDHAQESFAELREELAVARDKIANLETALESSRRNGAAIGILMYRGKITHGRTFELLWVASQLSHRKLRDVAEDVIALGEIVLPDGRHKMHSSCVTIEVDAD